MPLWGYLTTEYSTMIDFIIRFIKENPLTIVLLVMLIAFAPSLAGAMLIGLLVVVGLLLLIPVFMYLRLRRISRRMEQESQYSRSYTQREAQKQREGEVKVYTTTDRPQKRVSDDVGDYVDFEEVKEKKE